MIKQVVKKKYQQSRSIDSPVMLSSQLYEGLKLICFIEKEIGFHMKWKSLSGKINTSAECRYHEPF